MDKKQITQQIMNGSNLINVISYIIMEYIYYEQSYKTFNTHCRNCIWFHESCYDSLFAKLHWDGTLYIWSSKINCFKNIRFDDVKDVITTYGAMCILKNDNTLETYGEERYGGVIPCELKNVNKVVSTYGAFAAHLQNNTIISWGDVLYGGNRKMDDTGVIDIISSRNMFIILTNTGRVKIWGCVQYTNITCALYNIQRTITNIYSIQNTHIIKTKNSIIIWRSTGCCGNCDDSITTLDNILLVSPVPKYNYFTITMMDGSITNICTMEQFI